MQTVEGVELFRGTAVKPLEESDLNRITGGGYYGSWLASMPMGNISLSYENVSDWLDDVTFAHIPMVENLSLNTKICTAFVFGQLTMDDPIYTIRNAKYGVVTFRKPDAPISNDSSKPNLPYYEEVYSSYKIEDPEFDPAAIESIVGNWLVELPPYKEQENLLSWFDEFRHSDTRFVHVSDYKSAVMKFRTCVGLAMGILTIGKVLYLENSEYALISLELAE